MANFRRFIFLNLFDGVIWTENVSLSFLH